MRLSELLRRPPSGASDAPSSAMLAVVVASGTLGMHIFVPALPDVARDFAVSPGVAQLSVTLYLAGLATAQLFYGPISDRFGRRAPLLVALAIYCLSSLLGALAAGIGAMIALRVLQAVGACGGLVLGRAMVRDRSGAAEAASRLALLNMAMIVAPASAPVVGGLILPLLGWRGIFAFLAVVSAAVLVLAVLRLPETHARATVPPGFRAMAATYLRLLRMPVFVAYAFGGACVTTSLYGFLSASPFLFVEVLGRPASETGLYYLALLAGYSAGNLIANRTSVRLGLELSTRIACWVATVGAIGLLVLDRSGALSVAGVLATTMVFALGTGLASPNAAAGAISADPRLIGAAAGLYGFVQMAYGALCTLVVGFWHDGTALPVATVLTVSALGGLALLGFRRQAS